MRFAIHVDQLGGVHVSVPLRGTEPRMTEQLLDGAQISATLQQVSRKGMAQRVRADAHSRAALRDISTQQPVDASAGQAPVAAAEESNGAAGGSHGEGAAAESMQGDAETPSS